MKFLDERIQLRQQGIWGIAAILIGIFQIGYGFLKCSKVLAAGRVGDRGRGLISANLTKQSW